MIKTLDTKIFIILIVSTIIRLISIYLFGDTTVDNEWGIMLKNLEQYQMLSVRSVDGVPVPNIFMPPLYPLFLYSIKFFINDLGLFLIFIKGFQLIFSLISIIITYKTLELLFPKNSVLIGTILYAFFPLNIYAVSQISSATIQMLLISLFIYSYVNFFKNVDLKNSIFFSFASSLLILLRGEVFSFVILSLIYLLIKDKKNIMKILSICFLIGLLLYPYIYRNYKIFGVVTITKSSGYNLLKGNHPNTLVEGTGMFMRVGKIVPETNIEIEKLKAKGPIEKHDLIMDQILLNQALKFIKEDTGKYIKLYIHKFLSFLFIDINSTYPNYYSIFHIVPKLLLSLSTLAALFLTLNLRINLSNYFALFYLSNIGLFSFFFILPRYSLFLLPVQIIITLYGFTQLKKKFSIFNGKN